MSLIKNLKPRFFSQDLKEIHFGFKVQKKHTLKRHIRILQNEKNTLKKFIRSMLFQDETTPQKRKVSSFQDFSGKTKQPPAGSDFNFKFQTFSSKILNKLDKISTKLDLLQKQQKSNLPEHPSPEKMKIETPSLDNKLHFVQHKQTVTDPQNTIGPTNNDNKPNFNLSPLFFKARVFNKLKVPISEPQTTQHIETNNNNNPTLNNENPLKNMKTSVSPANKKNPTPLSFQTGFDPDSNLFIRKIQKNQTLFGIFNKRFVNLYNFLQEIFNKNYHFLYKNLVSMLNEFMDNVPKSSSHRSSFSPSMASLSSVSTLCKKKQETAEDFSLFDPIVKTFEGTSSHNIESSQQNRRKWEPKYVNTKKVPIPAYKLFKKQKFSYTVMPSLKEKYLSNRDLKEKEKSEEFDETCKETHEEMSKTDSNDRKLSIVYKLKQKFEQKKEKSQKLNNNSNTQKDHKTRQESRTEQDIKEESKTERERENKDIERKLSIATKTTKEEKSKNEEVKSLKDLKEEKESNDQQAIMVKNKKDEVRGKSLAKIRARRNEIQQESGMNSPKSRISTGGDGLNLFTNFKARMSQKYKK